MSGLDATRRERLVARFGEPAAAWCDGFDDLLAASCTRWGLTVREYLPAGGTSVAVLCARADSSEVVLKLTPDPGVAADEATALTAWAATPQVVDLLDTDLDNGALLLESLHPAPRLADTSWTLDEVGPLLAQLRAPIAVARLPTLADRVESIFALYRQRYGAASGDLAEVFDAGRAAALGLAEGDADGSAHGPVHGLVHGDLHPGNVLRTGRGLVAIDPRPCVGDPDADLVDWVLDGVLAEDELDACIAELAEAVDGIDPQRVREWCAAFAVLSAARLVHDDVDELRLRFLLRLASTAGAAP